MDLCVLRVRICLEKLTSRRNNFQHYVIPQVPFDGENKYFVQGSTNCGILASGMGGSGDGERKREEKFHLQGLKMVLRKFCLWNIRFRRNEVSLGGSTTINFALQICRTPSLQQASCNTVEFDGG